MKFVSESDSQISSSDWSAFETPLTADCIPLLEAADLNIYRENAFRITGLPVDATTKEIARQSDRLRKMEELGHAESGSRGTFVLTLSPTLDQLRGALQRLKEPERRFIDEFFWVWPMTFGQSTDDPAIQALSKGQISKAYEVWRAQEHDDTLTGCVATHNIAVVFHLMALDWTLYHLNADVDTEKEEQIRSYWVESSKRWQKIVSDDRIRDAVSMRIRSFNEARLTTGFGRRLVDTLPLALEKINAAAALQFAEQGQLKWAHNHVEFAGGIRVGADGGSRAAELVLAPLRKRAGQQIETAREAAQQDPKTGGKACRQLIEEAKRLRYLYDLFYADDAHAKTELLDEFAEATVDCLVQYQKSTDDNRLFVELLRAALALATDIQLRQRIGRNIEIGESNVRDDTLQPLYTRLNKIRDSKESGKIRLDDVKRWMIPELSDLAHSKGADADVVKVFCDALAAALRSISVDAHNMEEDFDTALEAIRLAVPLAKSPELKKRCQDDLATVQKNFTDYQRTQVNIDIGGNRLVINRHYVSYGSKQIPVNEINGVRFGIVRNSIRLYFVIQIPTSISYNIGICGAGLNFDIECKRVSRSEAQAKADFNSIIDALYYNVVPHLIARISASIKAGHSYDIGSCKLTKRGVYVRAGVFKQVDHLIPWREVRCGFSDGCLHVSSSTNSRLRASNGLRNVWNTVIFESISKELLKP